MCGCEWYLLINTVRIEVASSGMRVNGLVGKELADNRAIDILAKLNIFFTQTIKWEHDGWM